MRLLASKGFVEGFRTSQTLPILSGNITRRRFIARSWGSLLWGGDYKAGAAGSWLETSASQLEVRWLGGIEWPGRAVLVEFSRGCTPPRPVAQVPLPAARSAGLPARSPFVPRPAGCACGPRPVSRRPCPTDWSAARIVFRIRAPRPL